MALAGEVTRELSPIRSWSNKDYDLKLAEKARERELQVREATSADTFPFARPAGAQKILFTPAVRSRVHKCTWAYFFTTRMMSDKKHHFGRNDRKDSHYNLIQSNGLADLELMPIRVFNHIVHN